MAQIPARHVRRAAAMVGVLTSLALIVPATAALAANGTVNTPGSTLTLRTTPAPTSAAKASIPHGAALNLVCKKTGSTITGTQGTTNVWDYTSHAGKTGYVSAAYVVGGTTTSIPTCGQGTVRTSGATLTLRNSPSTSGAALASIPDRTTLTLQCRIAGTSISGTQGTTTTWNKVSYAGKTGYVSAAYVWGGTNSYLPNCTSTPPGGGGLTNPYGPAWGANGGWTARAAWLRDKIKSEFGLTCTTYATSSGEHATGNALDCWGPVETRRKMQYWAKDHARSLQVWYVIHEQRIWSLNHPNSGWRWMEDRGSITQNHYDHVHISVQTPANDKKW